MLCVHGLSANLCGFTYLAEHLAGPHRQVVAIDLRGRGRSEVTPPGTYGLDRHARDVVDVATALGADEFDVAGWSLGALISMRVAFRNGDRLRSVTLIDHAGPSDSAALVPIRDGLDRLDAVVPTPDAYLQAIRAGGVIDPWSEFWDATTRTNSSSSTTARGSHRRRARPPRKTSIKSGRATGATIGGR